MCEKPAGFWVSVDGKDDWKEWCEAENFGDLSQQYRHKVTLKADSNILLLTDKLEVLCFRERYGRETNNPLYQIPYIPWDQVAQDYQGIIIAPYQWELRLEEMWYYGWDCASGCIWDRMAIESVVLE
jgi:hypothetical protein